MVLSQRGIEFIASQCVDRTVIAVVNEHDLEELKVKLTEFVRTEIEKEGGLVQRKRRAIVSTGRGYDDVTNTGMLKQLSVVKDYLPHNFSARLVKDTGQQDRIFIEGYDDHGWTLDGYVLPRLASGLIVAKEVS